MNILIIHEVDYLRKVVYEFQTLAELLSLSEHNVYVIDYESMWSRGNPFGSLKTKEINVARAYPKASVKLIRPPFIKIPILSRASAFFSHYFVIKKVIKEKKIDVIILYSVPTNGLQTVYLAKKFGVPVIFRSIDILHELVPNKFLGAITKILEKQIYKRVNLILTISHKLSQYVIGMGASKDKVKLLLLGVDTNLFYPQLKNGSKMIVFVGTLPKFSGLDTFIFKFYRVLKEIPDAKLLIVGDGVQRVELENIITKLNLAGKVIITGFQPHKSIPDYINQADICISTFPLTNATRDIFPTKIIQYLACGKPVVSTRLHGLVGIIKGEEHGIVYTDNPDEMVSKIISLLKSGEDRKRLGQNAINYVRQYHSYDSIVHQLENELNNLIRSRVNEYCAT